MRSVDFYFDYSSPYAYLGSTQIVRIAERAGAEVRFRPFLLGALFRAIGTPLVPIAEMPPAKQRYQHTDLARWSRRWGVPFVFNTHFPLRTVDALRLTLLASEAERPALVALLMKAAWVLDRDLADRDVLRSILAEARGDLAAIDRLDEPEVKQALRDATDAAIEAGVPGAPSFVLDGELYWGQDRLHFVEAALREAS